MKIGFVLLLFIQTLLVAACSSPKALELEKYPKMDDFGRTELVNSIIQNNEKHFLTYLAAYPKWKNYQDKFGMSALLYAASTGNESFFNVLIQEGASISVKDHNNETVMHKFARVNMQAPIQYLRLKGLSIDESNKYGMNPLHIASSGWNVSQVLRFIENGANVDIVNAKKQTALHLAIDKFPSVDTLSKSKLIKDLTVIPKDTTKKGYWILTKDRFKNIWKSSKQFFVTLPDRFKSKPLVIINESVGLKTVNLLLDESPNLKIQDMNGLTAIALAKKKNNYQLIKLLVKRGLIKESEL